MSASKRKRVIAADGIETGLKTSEEAAPKGPNIDILIKYVETVTLECALSAQFSAYSPVLFSIEDVVKRANGDSELAFADNLPLARKNGQAYIEKTVAKWLNRQPRNVVKLLEEVDLRKATSVHVRKTKATSTLAVKVDDIEHTLELEGGGDQVLTAIALLRFPMLVMEKLRTCAGPLLDLEIDAPLLLSLEQNYAIEAATLCSQLLALSRYQSTN